jgi:hypothetical protein
MLLLNKLQCCEHLKQLSIVIGNMLIKDVSGLQSDWVSSDSIDSMDQTSVDAWVITGISVQQVTESLL